MTVSSLVLQTVEKLIKEENLEGIDSRSIGILPEGKVPASMGQRYITIHATTLLGLTPNKQVRHKRILFGVSINQRIRDIPNDRFGTIAYTDKLSMSNVIEAIIDIVESIDAFNLLVNSSPLLVNNDDLQLYKYQFFDSFVFHTMNLDPVHLYPSNFLTRAGNDKEELYDKIAGYQITAKFSSPKYALTINPLECQPLPEGYSIPIEA